MRVSTRSYSYLYLIHGAKAWPSVLKRARRKRKSTSRTAEKSPSSRGEDWNGDEKRSWERMLTLPKNLPVPCSPMWRPDRLYWNRGLLISSVAVALSTGLSATGSAAAELAATGLAAAVTSSSAGSAAAMVRARTEPATTAVMSLSESHTLTLIFGRLGWGARSMKIRLKAD